jgi:Family of unknown function (DUF6387)
MKTDLSDRQTRVPSWFKLSKYKDIGKLTRLDWYIHLSVRRDCLNAVGSHRDFWFETEPQACKSARQILKGLRRDPLRADKTVEQVMEGELECFLAQNITTSLAVRSLSMSALCDHLSGVTEEKRAAVCSYVNLEMREQMEFREANQEWLSQTVHVHRRTRDYYYWRELVEVDLNLPQDVLLRQFREWISEKQRERNEQGSQATPYAPNLKSWVEIGLLPCMDLMLWAAEKDVVLTTREIAMAIHDGGLARESATAKTTIPLARDFFRHGKKSSLLLRRLKVEIAEDLAEIQRAGIRRRRRSENRK